MVRSQIYLIPFFEYFCLELARCEFSLVVVFVRLKLTLVDWLAPLVFCLGLLTSVVSFSLVCSFLQIAAVNNNNNDNTRKLLSMLKILHPKADVERLYIARKDGGRGLTDVETAFKTATIGLDHYLKHKEGQYPKQLLEDERSKSKNPRTKNATKLKKEVTTPEFNLRTEKISQPQKMLTP